MTTSDQLPLESTPTPGPVDAVTPDSAPDTAPLDEALVARRDERTGVDPKQIVIWVVTGLLIVGGIAFLQGGIPLPWAEPNQAVPIQANLPASGPIPQIGEPAPDFTLTDLNGNPVQLSELRGKPVMLNFWATWCPPCRAEMPDIEAVHQAYGDRVTIVAVNMMEDPAAVADYFERVGLSFTAVMDLNGAVTGQYRIVAVPTSYFIGADGTVVDRKVGPMTKSAIEAKLRKVLQ